MVFIPKSILIALKSHDEIAAKMTGRFTSTSTWCLCSISWATNSHSSAWKSILLVMRPIDQQINFIALNIFRFKFVDVEAIGESCPKLQNLRLSRILSFCNTHSPRWSQKFINIPEFMAAHCQDLLNVTKEMSGILVRNISTTF